MVFRRDFAYPTSLEGRLHVTVDYGDVRLVETSAISQESKTLDHTVETDVAYGKDPGRLRIHLLKAGRRVLTEEEQAQAGGPQGSKLEGEYLDFLLTEKGWVPHGGADAEFRKTVWAEALRGTVPALMVETGAHPRSQWLSSSRRWQAGDRVVLTGSSIRMLFPQEVSGRLELTYQGEEAVGGHPCGVFTVNGSVTVRGEVDFVGKKRNAEITITEGKIWASLLYPVLLREEYETVQTVVRNPGSEAGSKLRGKIGIVKARAWEPRKE